MRLLSLLAVLLLPFLPVVPARAQGVELRLLEPMPGAVILGDSLTVHFEVSGMRIVPSSVPLEQAGRHPEANRADEGHLHLMLDLDPVMVWTKATPFTFTTVSPGSHLLIVEVVENDHSSRTPPVLLSRRITVQADSSQGVPSPIVMLPDTGSGGGLQMRPGLVLPVLGLVLICLGLSLRRRGRRRAGPAPCQ